MRIKLYLSPAQVQPEDLIEPISWFEKAQKRDPHDLYEGSCVITLYKDVRGLYVDVDSIDDALWLVDALEIEVIYVLDIVPWESGLKHGLYSFTEAIGSIEAILLENGQSWAISVQVSSTNLHQAIDLRTRILSGDVQPTLAWVTTPVNKSDD